MAIGPVNSLVVRFSSEIEFSGGHAATAVAVGGVGGGYEAGEDLENGAGSELGGGGGGAPISGLGSELGGGGGCGGSGGAEAGGELEDGGGFAELENGSGGLGGGHLRYKLLALRPLYS